MCRFFIQSTLLALLTIFFGAPGFAQSTGGVAGKLIDGDKKPVSYATVTVLRSDSSVVNGDLSKEDGTFMVSPVGAGSYILRVESISYGRKYVTVNVEEGKTQYVGNIKLKMTENALNAVEITGEKRVMELKVDKKVFNVEKNTTTAGGSAADVLQNVPSVSVDVDGNVNLRGKSNVTILIDGKPATLLGSDVTSALQSLPAGSIESVEVITNPSAKYDAQGTTGIINIITKKDGRSGKNGTITLGAGTGTGDKFNGNLGLNIRQGKWSTFLNSSGRINNTFNNVTTHRSDKAIDTLGNMQSYYTYEHVPRLFQGTFNSIGATYDIDKNNSVTLSQNVNVMQWGYSDNSNYYVFKHRPNETGDTLLHRERNSSALGGPVSFSTSFDYKRKFNKKGEELNIDATRSSNTMRRSQDYTTRTDAAGLAGPLTTSTAPGEGGNNTLTMWADYTDPLFTKNGKLGLGVKSQIYNFYSKNEPYIWVDTPGNVRQVDSTLFTTYEYKQQIHAAYVNWSDQLGKFSYQLGARVEDAVYDGTGSTPRPATFHNSFLNLFPSAFVSYQTRPDESIYLNYSRRTNRPGFYQMMPYKDFSNPGTVSMGNPAILPEFIDNVEFSYSRSNDKGNTFIFSTYIAQTRNLSERVLRPITGSADDVKLGLSEQIGQLLSMPMNIASGTTYGLEGTGRVQISKAWDATLNLNFFNNQLNIGNIDAAYLPFITNNSGYGWFGKMNTNVKLPANFSLQITGNYESPKVITQGKQRESYWLDIALKKNLWKNKASLVVNCSDVFWTRQFINDYDNTTYSQTINRVKQTRVGNLTFTYRFGKSESSGKSSGGEKGRSGKKAEKKRVEKPSDEDRGKNLKQNDDSDNSR
jgi:iron complex outermembrane recepter protein